MLHGYCMPYFNYPLYNLCHTVLIYMEDEIDMEQPDT